MEVQYKCNTEHSSHSVFQLEFSPLLTFHTPWGALTFGSHSDVSSLSANMVILMILCLIRVNVRQTILRLQKVTWIQCYWKGIKALRNITSLICVHSFWPRIRHSSLWTFADSLKTQKPQKFWDHINQAVGVFFCLVSAL